LIQDCDGDVIVSGRGKIECLLNTFQAELIDCLQGIQAVVDLGIGWLIVETNTKMVIQALNTNDYEETAVGVLIAEIKSLVSSSFISFECSFKSRDCNKAAHELAVLGYLCNPGEEQVMSSIPESVHVIVANDLLAIE